MIHEQRKNMYKFNLSDYNREKTHNGMEKTHGI